MHGKTRAHITMTTVDTSTYHIDHHLLVLSYDVGCDYYFNIISLGYEQLFAK